MYPLFITACPPPLSTIFLCLSFFFSKPKAKFVSVWRSSFTVYITGRLWKLNHTPMCEIMKSNWHQPVSRWTLSLYLSLTGLQMSCGPETPLTDLLITSITFWAELFSLCVAVIMSVCGVTKAQLWYCLVYVPWSSKFFTRDAPISFF